MARRKAKPASSATRGAAKPKTAPAKTKDAPNPPRTTKGWFTSPKFGSAGSGGAEFEPGPERD